MATFAPVFKFYRDYFNLVDDHPDLVISGDDWRNQIERFQFSCHRFGGATEAELEGAAFWSHDIETSWYLRFLPAEGLRSWYVGQVEDYELTGFDRIRIKFVGLINLFNTSVRENFHLDSVSIPELVEALAVRAEGEPTVKDLHIYSKVREGWTLPTQRVQWTWIPGEPLLDQLRGIEALTADFAYGIASGTAGVDGDIRDTDFFGVFGPAPIYREWILGREIEPGWKSGVNRSTIINQVVLRWKEREGSSTTDTDRERVLRRDGSIRAYGLRSKVFNVSAMTDDDISNFQNLVLARYSQPVRSWTFAVSHSDHTGSANNLVETGLPWPWAERVALIDPQGALRVDAPEIQGLMVRVDQGKLSVEVRAGEDRSDIEEFFKATRVTRGEGNSDSTSTGDGAISGRRCPARYRSSISYDLTTLEPPIAWPSRETVIRPGNEVHPALSSAGIRVPRGWGWIDPSALWYASDGSAPGNAWTTQSFFANKLFNIGWTEAYLCTPSWVNFPDNLCAFRNKWGTRWGGRRITESPIGNNPRVAHYNITSGQNTLDGIQYHDAMPAALQFHLGLYMGAEPTPAGVTSYSGASANDLADIISHFGNSKIFIVGRTRNPYRITVNQAQPLPSIPGITVEQIESSIFMLTDAGATNARAAGYLYALWFQWNSVPASPAYVYRSSGVRYWDTFFRSTLWGADPGADPAQVTKWTRSDTGARVYIKRALHKIYLTALTRASDVQSEYHYEFRVRDHDDTW